MILCLISIEKTMVLKTHSTRITHQKTPVPIPTSYSTISSTSLSTINNYKHTTSIISLRNDFINYIVALVGILLLLAVAVIALAVMCVY